MTIHKLRPLTAAAAIFFAAAFLCSAAFPQLVPFATPVQTCELYVRGLSDGTYEALCQGECNLGEGCEPVAVEAIDNITWACRCCTIDPPVTCSVPDDTDCSGVLVYLLYQNHWGLSCFNVQCSETCEDTGGLPAPGYTIQACKCN